MSEQTEQPSPWDKTKWKKWALMLGTVLTAIYLFDAIWPAVARVQAVVQTPQAIEAQKETLFLVVSNEQIMQWQIITLQKANEVHDKKLDRILLILGDGKNSTNWYNQ